MCPRRCIRAPGAASVPCSSQNQEKTKIPKPGAYAKKTPKICSPTPGAYANAKFVMLRGGSRPPQTPPKRLRRSGFAAGYRRSYVRPNVKTLELQEAKMSKCQNARTARSPNVKMSKRSNCKKPKCQNARTARSPKCQNVKTLELQEAQMSKRSNCKKPEWPITTFRRIQPNVRRFAS